MKAVSRAGAIRTALTVKEMLPDAQIGAITIHESGEFDVDIAWQRALTEKERTDLDARLGLTRDLLTGVRVETLSCKDAVAVCQAAGERLQAEAVGELDRDHAVARIERAIVVLDHADVDLHARAVRTVSLSGVYWKGDPSRPQLTRIRGVAARDDEALARRLAELESARRRDHRILGKEMALFAFHPYAMGAAFWLEKGLIMRETLGQKMRELLLANGYAEVRTPQLYDRALWQTSGHWDVYRENMFVVPSGEDGALSLKPMNCPSHALLFGMETRSFRDLPVRLHDQSVLHRNEISGSLGGLTRLRAFAQDDAHIFARADQIEDEVLNVLSLIDRVYKAFGFHYDVKLSTRPEKSLGDDALWERAERALADALAKTGISYAINAGDGAFYGPKIDCDVTDAMGRKWQVATVQLDFNLPERFQLEYVDADGSAKRPVVIHRAIYGSIERFLAIVLEHFAGDVPLWLAPEQVRVIPVSEKSATYAVEVRDALRGVGARASVDPAVSTLGSRIRASETTKVPFAVVVGEREAATRTLAVRRRGAKETNPGSTSLDAFVSRMESEVRFRF